MSERPANNDTMEALRLHLLSCAAQEQTARDSVTPARRATAQAIHDLHTAGMSWREIGQLLGMSHVSVLVRAKEVRGS